MRFKIEAIVLGHVGDTDKMSEKIEDMLLDYGVAVIGDIAVYQVS
jgi:hypothetical protein